MIYSVHGYYGKINSRKKPSKIEAIVFAANSELAESLVEGLFDGYPADLQGFSTIGGMEQDLQAIYSQRPELAGIDPNRGYIYKHIYHADCIRKYFK